MKAPVSTVRIAVLAFLLVSIFPAGHSQGTGQLGQPEQSRQKLIQAAREIMAEARYCALITEDAAGRPQARAVDPFPPDENMVIWLGTNPKTRKVMEIRRNPRVTLFYLDREGQAYVTISGTARLVNDAQEKTKHWKDEWQAFYPDRVKGYLLIVVTPDKLEVISEKKGIAGDPITWRPPSVRFRRGQPR